MTVNDILTLAKAGYNSNQISVLLQASQITATTPVVQATVPVAPPVVQETVPIPPVVQATVPPVVQPSINVDPIMAQLEKLTGVIQANALLSTNMPTPQNTDDILASIIAPPVQTK